MNFLGYFKYIFLCLITFISCNNLEKKSVNSLKYSPKIDSLITDFHKNGFFNGNILVVKNDTVFYENYLGYTNKSEETKLNKSSIFNIGSIAKEFNGVAIMMLVEQRKISLDDPISKFNLELPNWSKRVSIRHLLNYSSGIPKIDFLSTKNDTVAWEILRKSEKLLFEPGTNFLYDNSNVFLQQRIIEKVTNQSYKQFIIKNIVKPLQLSSAVFDPKQDYPNRISCYGLNKVSCPELEFISGWLWLTIDDLLKWIEAMNNNKIISQESFDVILRNPYVKGKTGSIGEYFENIQLQRHDGNSYKFKSVYLNDFKEDITIILLSNTKNNVIPIAHTIHNILLDRPYKSVHKAIEKEILKDVELGIKAYHKLKNSKVAYQYTFSSSKELNRVGYQLLRLKRTQDAIKIFQLMVLEFPKTADAYDCLGEAYLENRQYHLALKNYKKAIELGGTNGNAKKMIQKINNLLE